MSDHVAPKMLWLIWSTKHGGAYYRQGSVGYALNEAKAGRFTTEEATLIQQNAATTIDPQGHELPGIIITPAPESMPLFRNAERLFVALDEVLATLKKGCIARPMLSTFEPAEKKAQIALALAQGTMTVPPRTWRTKDGRTLLIAEMEDAHLMNTIRFLKRQHEAAIDDASSADDMSPSPFVPEPYGLDWLREEAVKRGLLSAEVGR